jgi:hypothetical protein
MNSMSKVVLDGNKITLQFQGGATDVLLQAESAEEAKKWDAAFTIFLDEKETTKGEQRKGSMDAFKPRKLSSASSGAGTPRGASEAEEGIAEEAAGEGDGAGEDAQEGAEESSENGGSGSEDDAAAQEGADGPAAGGRKMSVMSQAALRQLSTTADKVERLRKQLGAVEQSILLFSAKGFQMDADERSQMILDKDKLASFFGQICTIESRDIDSVMTGGLTSGKDEAKANRKALARQAEVLEHRIERASKLCRDILAGKTADETVMGEVASMQELLASESGADFFERKRKESAWQKLGSKADGAAAADEAEVTMAESNPVHGKPAEQQLPSPAKMARKASISAATGGHEGTAALGIIGQVTSEAMENAVRKLSVA